MLNGLGFAQQSLYLTPRFFESKPTERLIGEGIEPGHLHDDTLGRALDDLYDYGLTELFRDLATHAANQLDLTSRFAHLDATSFSLHGEYESEEESASEVISVQKGYSRDRPPDLNQVVLDLMVEHQAGLPMLMEPLSGNSSDQGSFPELIDRHLSHLQHAHGFEYVVADSALYSSGHIRDLNEAGTKFITRVPGTIEETKQAVARADRKAMKFLTDGYRGEVLHSTYGEVKQRWLPARSEEAEQRAIDQVAKQIGREHTEEQKAFRELTNQEFACREDAEKALSAFEENLTASVLTERRVLRTVHFTMDSEGTPVETGEEKYLLQGRLVPSEAREAELVNRKSLFIVATNELDRDKLSDEELLKGYKGLRFCRARISIFEGSAVCRRSAVPARREADHGALDGDDALSAGLLGPTMAYPAEVETGQSYPDQKGNPTQRPTARWVFESFLCIHALFERQKRLVLNMKDRHRRFLTVVGQRYDRLYASHPRSKVSKVGWNFWN